MAIMSGPVAGDGRVSVKHARRSSVWSAWIPRLAKPERLPSNRSWSRHPQRGQSHWICSGCGRPRTASEHPLAARSSAPRRTGSRPSARKFPIEPAKGSSRATASHTARQHAMMRGRRASICAERASAAPRGQTVMYRCDHQQLAPCSASPIHQAPTPDAIKASTARPSTHATATADHCGGCGVAPRDREVRAEFHPAQNRDGVSQPSVKVAWSPWRCGVTPRLAGRSRSGHAWATAPMSPSKGGITLVKGDLQASSARAAQAARHENIRQNRFLALRQHDRRAVRAGALYPVTAR